MKYAVVVSGGKQYVTREGETIEVDRLPLEVGKTVEFKDVLLLVDNAKVKVGSPFVRGAKVKGTVVDQFKAPKIIVFKYIPKERYRRKRGHRQRYSRIAIDKISVTQPRKKAEAPAKAKEAEGAKAKKAPAAKSAEAKATSGKPKTKKSTKAKASKPAEPKKKTSAKATKPSTKTTKKPKE
jgi:large subunit ribosomal protein L21